MIKRDELTGYLQQLLSCGNFEDYAPNGLQVEGAPEIFRICTAVTASADVIEQAAMLRADALLVHHGYFWRGESPVLTGMKRHRIAGLMNNNISLFAYHLPLDCHAELGNNACLGKLFDIDFVKIKKYRAGKTPDLLWSANLLNQQSVEDFAVELENKLGSKPMVIKAGEKPIHRLAWCSGGAQDFIVEAHALGADAYLSGEISERTYYQAKELGIHYFSCGHHATERLGIQALGNHLSEVYQLEHQFIDSFNPV